jgi:hypothetical protein
VVLERIATANPSPHRGGADPYLKEIKADISYFKRSYERADLQVTITGLDPEASAAAIDARLGRT